MGMDTTGCVRSRSLISHEVARQVQAGTNAVKVGRRSFEHFNGVAPGPMMWKTIWWHTYDLYLPK